MQVLKEKITKRDIFVQLREILVSALEVSEEDIILGARLHEDLGCESIDILDINYRLEKSFGIKNPLEEFRSLSNESQNSPTVQMLLDFLCQKLGAK